MIIPTSTVLGLLDPEDGGSTFLQTLVDMCCYERVSTTDDVTAAVLLAILGLVVSSETSENGMYSQIPGCFNVGDCFLFTHLHLVLRLKNDWSCVSTAFLPSWHA